MTAETMKPLNELKRNILTEPLLHPSIAEMLKDMEPVFAALEIDYYMVGAVARDIHLSADPNSVALRKTNDVDLAILVNDDVQFKQLKQALEETGHFSQHPTENIKLYYKNAIEVDLLPFGGIEQADRNVRLTDPLFVLNMPGFSEIYPSVKDMVVSEDLSVKVCTMEGIILLKLISNDDRPQRTKDITDIEHIIRVYFDLYDGSIYDEHFDTMDMYGTGEKDYLQLVCARVIGRKIKILLNESEDLMARVKGILAKRPTTWWNAMLDGMNDR
jgi:predicted nucleotidyltransferase